MAKIKFACGLEFTIGLFNLVACEYETFSCLTDLGRGFGDGLELLDIFGKNLHPLKLAG